MLGGLGKEADSSAASLAAEETSTPMALLPLDRTHIYIYT